MGHDHEPEFGREWKHYGNRRNWASIALSRRLASQPVTRCDVRRRARPGGSPVGGRRRGGSGITAVPLFPQKSTGVAACSTVRSGARRTASSWAHVRPESTHCLAPWTHVRPGCDALRRGVDARASRVRRIASRRGQRASRVRRQSSPSQAHSSPVQEALANPDPPHAPPSIVPSWPSHVSGRVDRSTPGGMSNGPPYLRIRRYFCRYTH